MQSRVGGIDGGGSAGVLILWNTGQTDTTDTTDFLILARL